MSVLKVKDASGNWIPIGLGADVMVGAWTPFVPRLNQGPAVTKTVTSATYLQLGKLVIVQVSLAVTGPGTAATRMTVGLPITARAQNALQGSAQVYDASTATDYNCFTGGASTTDLFFFVNGAAGDAFGLIPNIALASGDNIQYAISYEAA